MRKCVKHGSTGRAVSADAVRAARAALKRVQVIVEAGAAQVQQKLGLPGAGEVESHVGDAVHVARQFHAILVEHTHATRGERGHEDPHLEHDALARAGEK